MLRKLVSTLTIFALALVGLSQASPTSAASFGPTVVGSSGNLSFNIPLDEEKAMVIWRDGSSSPNTLKSSILHADGTVTDEATIYSPPANFYFSISTSSAWAKMRDGSIVLTWTIKNSSTGRSEVMVGFSDNAIEWSLPQTVSSGNFDTNSIDCFVRCGFLDSHIASDGLGRIAVQFVTSSGYEDASSLVQYFSTDGVSWSPPSYPSVNFDYIHSADIVGLPLGGFVASWAAFNDSNHNRFANRTVGKTSAWTVPQLLSTTYQVDGAETIFLVTAPDEITFLFATSPNDTDRYAIVARRLSLKTMIWAPEQTILVTGTAGWLNGSIRADVAPDGTVAVGVASALNGEPVSYLHFNTFKGTVIGTKTVPVTFDEQGSALTAVFANPNGSYSLIYHSGNGPSKLLTLSANQQAETTTLEFGAGQTWESSAVRSTHGNIFMASNMQVVVKALSIVRASKPTLGAQPSVNGTRAVGKKLTSTLASFLSFNGVGLNTYQWYACSAAVPANTTSLPSRCAPIAKATKNSFTVTAKQKGKFITLAISNTNAVGTNTVFTPAAAKVK